VRYDNEKSCNRDVDDVDGPRTHARIRASVRHYDLSRRGLAAAALRAIVTTHDDRDNIRRGHWTQTGTGVRWA